MSHHPRVLRGENKDPRFQHHRRLCPLETPPQAVQRRDRRRPLERRSLLGESIPHKMSKASPSLGHEDAFEIQGHETEIELLISQHTQGLTRKIKEKDEEMAKMGKLIRLLQEKVKSLLSENRVWRGLAQDNEAEPDPLRATLQHLLGGGGGGVDDAESSCCGSNDPGREGAAGGDAAAEPWSVHPYLSRCARTRICHWRRRNGREGPWMEM